MSTQDSTRAGARDRYVPDRYRELIFVAGVFFGMVVFSVGIIGLILGTALGFRGGDLLTPVQRTILAVAGLGLIYREATQRVRAFEGLPVEGYRRARAAGAVLVVPLFVGATMGLAALGGAAIATPLSVGIAPLSAAAVGFGVTAAVNAVVEALTLGLGPVVEPRIEAAAGRLRASGGPVNRAAAATLTGLRRDVHLYLFLGGLFLFLMGAGAQRTFSAPFLRTLWDKVALLGGGVLCLYLGWKMIRGAGRVVGW